LLITQRTFFEPPRWYNIGVRIEQGNGPSPGPLETAVAELEAAPSFPAAYAARVRAAVRRLDPLPPTLDVAGALALVAQEARIDVDAPLRTRRRGARAAKVVVKRFTAWYLKYLGDQVGDLGQAMVHLGEALAERVDGVGGEVGDLRDRVARLEAQSLERGDRP
jgi:hypothetical protein